METSVVGWVLNVQFSGPANMSIVGRVGRVAAFRRIVLAGII